MNKDSEELIEWLDSIRPGKVQHYESVSQYNYQYEMNINRTQVLLRVGLDSVKFRDMWEKLYREHEGDFTRGVRIGIIMDYIKQEYFPKPKPKSKLDEALEYYVKQFMKSIKSFLEDYYHIEPIKRYEKEIKERNKKGGISC